MAADRISTETGVPAISIRGVVREPEREANPSQPDPADEAERSRTQWTGFYALAGVWVVVAVVVAVIVAAALILYFAA